MLISNENIIYTPRFSWTIRSSRELREGNMRFDDHKKKNKSFLKGINALYYNISRGNAENIHHLCREVESKTIRSEAVAQQAFKLQSNKKPDIIIGHPGWGEMLFLKDIWPKSLRFTTMNSL